MRDARRAAIRSLFLALGALAAALSPPAVSAEPGEDTYEQGPWAIEYGSLAPIVTESGPITLSVDGSGSNGGPYQYRAGAPMTLRVQKPAGATVRRAFVAAASTGFSGRKLAAGDVTLDGAGFPWEISTTSNISSWNHWAEVTALVKPKLDAAPPGLVSFSVGEVNTTSIDGEILAVIFDDPAQTTHNTVALLFGAQHVAGDTFHVALAGPIDKTDPALAIELSLGISFGFQAASGAQAQRSIVRVNNSLLTSLAGGQDDGASQNGTLITVGGIGNSPANPPPGATSGPPTGDDELYNLLPVVASGASAITIFSQNPSNDDNIFFAALSLRAAAAIVGEGIVLGPVPAPDGEVGTSFTATAKVQDAGGQPIAGRLVTFSVLAGPHAGTTGTAVTDMGGHASFTYAGTAAGVDELRATFVDAGGQVQTSNTAIKRWIQSNHPPEAVCQDVLRAVDESCVANVHGAHVGGFSYDLDGDPISFALSPAGPFELGDTDVTMTVTDIASSSSSCTAVITAVDETAPTIACPFGIEAECTGREGASVTVPDASGDDNCGTPAITGPAGTAVYPLGGALVTFTATDDAGNDAVCYTSVFVYDATPPALACPAPVVAECTGNGAATVDLPGAAATDVCGDAHVSGPAGPASYPLGVAAVGFSAVDDWGNTADCATSVTVVDTLAPELTCPAPIVAECTGGGAATVDVPDAIASDACGGVIVTGPAGAASYPLGTTTLGFGTTDDFANLAFCATSVTVADRTAPVFDPATLGPRTVLGSCDGAPVGFTPPAALDACQDATVTCTPVPGAAGTHASICTATDGSGNVATAAIEVTVLAPLRLAFGAPLADDNAAGGIETDADATNLFQVNRTIPNKVKVHACDGADVTRAIAGGVTLRLSVHYRDDASTASTTIEPEYQGVGGPDGRLVLVGNHFQYNQKTAAGTYPAGSSASSRYFQNVVTLTYSATPGVVAAQEDARLESK